MNGYLDRDCVRCSDPCEGDACDTCGMELCPQCAAEYEPPYCDMPQCHPEDSDGGFG